MGTTPTQGYPYPEPADRARNGSVAFRGLAEAVENSLRSGAGLVIARAESAAATGGAVDFPGAVAHASDFTYSAGAVTYTGPDRLFVMDIEVEVQAAASAGVDSGVSVYVNGVEFAGSYDRVDAPTGGVITRHVVHRITTPARVSTGDVFTVTCGGTSGTLGKTGIRIYPIGPVLP
jgi:hypothetical protein